MITTEEIDKTIAQLNAQVVQLGCNKVYPFPMADYLAYLRKVKPYLGGVRENPFAKQKGRRLFNEIRSRFDQPTLCLYNKLALFLLMRKSLDQLPQKNLPDDIVSLYDLWFARVLEDLSNQSDDYYDLQCHAYVQDVGVCCLRSIPVGGAWIVQLARVGLRPFSSGSLRETVRYVGSIIFYTRGFLPFCVIHTVLRYIPRFTNKEMRLAYSRIAQLMQRYPRIKGIYRHSWFLDPQLERVSPDLAYLRQLPEKHGAKFFHCGTKENDIAHALAMSAKRRKLYEEGKYIPIGYACIWSRKDILRWAATC